MSEYINIVDVLNELEDTDFYDGKLSTGLDNTVYYGNNESKLNKFIDKNGNVRISDIVQIVSKEEADKLIRGYTNYRLDKSEKTRDTDGFHFKHKVAKLRKEYREQNTDKFYSNFKSELEQHMTKFPLVGHYMFQYETTGYGSEEYGRFFLDLLEKNGYIKENGFILTLGVTPNKINIQIL